MTGRPLMNDAINAAMTDDQIRQWIEACNHEPARQVLREYIKLRALRPEPATEPATEVRREAIAQALLDRFIARGKRRSLSGVGTFRDGTKIAELPASYKDDFMDDADAVILALPCADEAAIRADEREKCLSQVCESLFVLADGWKAQPGKEETAIAVSNAAVFICGKERAIAIRNGGKQP